jgi:hypothetical protein
MLGHGNDNIGRYGFHYRWKSFWFSKDGVDKVKDG